MPIGVIADMINKKMRVYLDNCCYNRPFDDQGQLSVQLETQAKLWIQDLIKDGKIALVVSFFSLFENSANKDIDKAEHITGFFEYASVYIDETHIEEIRTLRDEIMATGIKHKDAIHLAASILANSDYFITTDKRVLKYKSERIRTINPIDFIRIWEGQNDD
jgi:predicted nucleic acid-binding protein